MDSMIGRKLSEKDKWVLLELLYFLLAIAFAPFSFLVWYILNKKKFSFFYPLIGMLVILVFGSASYVYVFQPIAKYRLDFGIGGAVVYGGLLTTLFFMSRFTYPKQASRVYFFFYYFGYMLLTSNIILWTVIPRYYLVKGIDQGVIMMMLLGVIWIITILFINKQCPPIEEGIVVNNPKEKKVALLCIWLLAIGILPMLKVIIYASSKLIK